ncbi:MAG: hypothetical protein HFE71_12205 [Emergencia sp.]|jgi:predicted metal-binding protein|uniref:DUF2284 domain-containing protein n=1 Tax=Senimuribacter intestinalis TaxID=2941507 RepID=UPI00203D9D94|nr:DUF2284 domain-containing protein [Senimuribacter intestinalis]MCI9477208.1 hypothetical protein [Emergencia sp.]
MSKIQRFETHIPIDELMNQYFDFELTHSKCRQCSGYQKTWSCPAFDFEPADFWRGFSSLHLIVDRVSCASAATIEEAQNWLFAEKSRFDAEMRELEKKSPGSYGLAAQECVACKKCARLSGLPCIHPEIMRYGLESIGILAVKLVEDKFGFSAKWSDGVSIPDYYLLVGGVILKD